MKDFKIKIVAWFWSNNYFIVKIKKQGGWFWKTIKIAEQDIDGDWQLNIKTYIANNFNKKQVLSQFSCWQDYLDYTKEEIVYGNKRQKQIETKRKEEKLRLNNFYK